MVLSFEFVYVVNYSDGFPDIEQLLHIWDEANLIMLNDCFDVFLDSVGKNFMNIDAKILNKILAN